MKVNAQLVLQKGLGWVVIGWLATALSSCSWVPPPPVKLPPIKEGWRESRPLEYLVQPGETLYSIAWNFGVDYRELAKINSLKQPYRLQVGWRLRLGQQGAGRKLLVLTKPLKLHSNSRTILGAKKIQPVVGARMGHWQWPTRGVLVGLFDNQYGGNKGIDISGKREQVIVASRAGRVVYSGNGIRSYGQLIIVKHDAEYLSAYGYNSQSLVHEGQLVKAGEKIALMGHDPRGRSCLHFEIRRAGLPVNPLERLKAN